MACIKECQNLTRHLQNCSPNETKVVFRSLPMFASEFANKLLMRRRKFISPIPRGGRRKGRSVFLSRRPFGYYLPIASYLTIFANHALEALVFKCLAQGHKGPTAHRCFLFCFSPSHASSFVNNNTTRLDMKDSLKAQQW